MSEDIRSSKNRQDLLYRKKRRTTGHRQAAALKNPRKPGLNLRTNRYPTGKKGFLESLGIDLKPDWISKLISGQKSSKSGRRYAAPPVMVRGAPIVRQDQKKNSQKSSPVRRRYDMNVPNAPAASISLPAIPQIGFSWRLLSMVLFAFLGFAVYYLWTSPMFIVDSVEINGLQRIKPYDINAVLGVTGLPSFLVDVDKLSDQITEKFPAITQASIEFEYPNKVMISVEERQPALIWVQGGRTDLIDADGIAFPLLLEESELATIDLPVVDASGGFQERETAPIEETQSSLFSRLFSLFSEKETEIAVLEPRQILSPEMVNAILMLKDYAPPEVPLLFLDDHGLAWENPEGWMVYFGDAENIDMKLRVYHTIQRQLERNGETPKLVSVEWVNAPYYRLER